MEKILNRLANGVIDGPDDLMGIGECLNLLDDLEGQIGTTGPLAKTIERARLIFKRLILEESADRSADWLEVQKLLGSLGPLHFGQGAMEDAGDGNRRELRRAQMRKRTYLRPWQRIQGMVQGPANRPSIWKASFDEESSPEVDRAARP